MKYHILIGSFCLFAANSNAISTKSKLACLGAGSSIAKVSNYQLISRLESDANWPTHNKNILAALENTLRVAIRNGSFGEDPFNGKLVPPDRADMPNDRIFERLRAVGPVGKPLSLDTIDRFELEKTYSFIIRKNAGKHEMFLGGGHRAAGNFIDVVSAGEIRFKKIRVGGLDRIVVERVTLQSGLYRPHAERAIPAFQTLVEAGFDSRHLAETQIDTGIPVSGNERNKPIVDLAAYLPIR